MEGDAGEDVSLGAAVGVGLRGAAAVGVGLRGAGDTRSASDGAIVVIFLGDLIEISELSGIRSLPELWR